MGEKIKGPIVRYFELIRAVRDDKDFDPISDFPELSSASTFLAFIRAPAAYLPGQKATEEDELWSAAKNWWQSGSSKKLTDLNFFFTGAWEDHDRKLREQYAKFQKDRQIAANAILIFDSIDEAASSVPILTATEQTAVDALADRLCSKHCTQSNLVIYRNPFDGEDIIACGLRAHLGEAGRLSAHYKRIIHLVPSLHIRQPIVSCLKAKLSMDPDASVQDLRARLDTDQILVVISAVDSLIQNYRGEADGLNDLLNTGSRTDKSRFSFLLFCDRYDPHVAAVTKAKIEETARPRRFPLSDTIMRQATEWALPCHRPLMMHPLDPELLSDREQQDEHFGENWRTFEQLLEGYEALHQEACRDPSPYRLRLAEWGLSTGSQPPEGADDHTGQTLRPCDLRIRAFLSANRSVFSIDVTMGFKELCGLSYAHWPEEIQLYHRIASLWLERVKPQAAKNAARDRRLDYLRFVSTGVYWVRGSTIKRLAELDVTAASTKQAASQTKAEAERLFPSSTFEPKFLLPLLRCGAIREDPPHLLSAFDGQYKTMSAKDLPEETLQETRYYMPLGLRAIVQDEWRDGKDRDQRAVAHLSLANMLWDIDRERKSLETELPFGRPAVGRGRVFFLLEIIRHLVRAGEFGSLQTRETCEHWESPYKKTSGANFERNFRTCRPGTTKENIHILAFRHVFLSEMSRPGIEALTRRYGLYRVLSEVASLMEQAGYTLETEAASFAQLRASAALEMGALEHAEDLLKVALKSFSQQECYLFDLHMIAFDLERDRGGDMDKARGYLEKAEACRAALPDGQSEPERKLEARRRDRKLAGRWAGLHLWMCDPAEALKVLETQLREEGAGAQELDFVNNVRGLNGHRYIDAIVSQVEASESDITNKDDPDNCRRRLKRARIICGDRAIYTREGANLHSGLGFRIQLAKLQRLLGNMEESDAELIRVRDYMLQHGASTRTMLAFQIEAGETLLKPAGLGDNDRPAQPHRALGMYLLPAIQQARELGFRTWEQKALVPARKAWRLILEDENGGPEQVSIKELCGMIAHFRSSNLTKDVEDRPGRVIRFDPFKPHSVLVAAELLQNSEEVEKILGL